MSNNDDLDFSATPSSHAPPLVIPEYPQEEILLTGQDISPVEMQDAQKLLSRVEEVMSSDYPDLVSNGTWTDAKIQELDITVRSVCNKNMKETRERVVRHVQYLVGARLHGVGILQSLMDDMNITELECLAFDQVYMVDFSGRKLTDIKFESAEAYINFATSMVDKSGLSLSNQKPIADFSLPNKTRVNIVGQWASTSGQPIITMRKPPTAVRAVTRSELIEWGAFSEEMYELMGLASDSKLNAIISGETGSGKTTIIRLLMDFLRGSSEKVILLQDTPEVDPIDPGFPLVLLQTINRDKDPVTFFDLLRSTLRMNPDRTWIGEVRGIEAAEMIESNMAGAKGTLASMHADTVSNMVQRLIMLMFRAGFDFSTSLIQQMIHSSIDLVYQTRILPDGSKKIVEVSEILPLDVAEKEGIDPIHILFKFETRGSDRDENGIITKIHGVHKKMNNISKYRRERMLDYGISTPDKFGGVPWEA